MDIMSKKSLTTFIDCNCMLGNCDFIGMDSFPDAGSLLHEMDDCGINEAIVYSSLAAYCSPSEGNQILIDELKDCKRLYPCPVILPHHTGEFPLPDDYTSFLKANDIKIVKIMPNAFKLPLHLWIWGEILGRLQEIRMPVMLDFSMGHWSESIDWESIYRVVHEFGDLPVIITGMGMAADRFVYPLFEKFKNLYMETSYYQVHDGIDGIVSKFGSSRLIFGTGMPVRSPYPPMTALLTSSVGTDEIAAIAGGNIRNLMEGVRFE